MSENGTSFLSRRARGALFGVAAGLLLLLSGDSARTAIVQGIDPLDILKVLSRPNVFIVLSSSGTMGDTLNSTATSRITLGGDHPSSKLRIAKDTIRQFIQDNQTAANFQLGIYEQPAGPPPSLFIDSAPGREPDTDPFGSTGTALHRFIYTSTDPNAASISVNVGVASLAAPGNVVRDAATDNVTDGAGAALFRLWAGVFFDGETIQVDSMGAFCSSTPGAPAVPPAPPIVTVQQLSAGCGGLINQVVFTFFGVAGDWGNPAGSCDGHVTDPTRMMTLRQCNDVDQLTDVAPFLDLQVKIDPGTSRPFGYPSPDNIPNPAITTFGVLNGGFQPVAETLIDLKASFASLYGSTISLINPAAARPRSIAILIMDTDDSCSASGTPGGAADANALRAAHKAQALRERIASLDPASGVSTFVIAYGGAVNTTRANWIGWGGSGMQLVPPGDTNPATQWPAPPTTADLSACPDCQVAYQAPNGAKLYAAMLDAVAQAANTGEFSASGQVVSTVFELIQDPDGAGPLKASAFDPTTRYNQRVNILFQSTFDLPGWRGRLFAFRNDGTFLPVPVGVNDGCLGSGGSGIPIWEPGCTLFENVVKYVRDPANAGANGVGSAGGVNVFTFAELHNNATSATASTAAIKRRVFTTSRNGIWTRSTSSDAETNPQFDATSPQGTNVISLWPPTQAGLNNNPAVIGSACATDGVDPADPNTAGCLDAPLGLAGLTFADYQSTFRACAGQPAPDTGFGTVPAACSDLSLAANGLTVAFNTARKEARQIVLASIAGAAISLGTDGNPLRDTTSGTLLFEAKDWLLGDTQNAAPVVVTPPLRFEPSRHVTEFTLYRDGTRDINGEGENKLHLGFGLRNPDFDNASPQTDVDLKPAMTVVYLGTNERLHAFRGGPQCPLTTTPGGAPGSAGCGFTEGGSEELWSFIPHDLLPKQKELIQNFGQTRRPHTYGIASSLRGASVFLPSSSGFIINGAPFAGRWRTLMFFGRGPGGKYVTSVDVTAPGPFTRAALDTYPPWIMWSRGNPDTNDGSSCAVGTPNNTSADCTLYNDAGQTWSVPAVGNVDSDPLNAPGGNCTPAPEWRVWMGSGYGEEVGNGTTHFEGKRFFELDALTGNVCRTGPFFDPPSAGFLTADTFTSPIANNAFVAAPAGFNSRALDPPGLTVHTSPDKVTRVYIGDLRGRMWRWSVKSGVGTVLFDAGAGQPIADAAALLKFTPAPSPAPNCPSLDCPRVFFEAGNDNRVPDSAAPFKLFGVEDRVTPDEAPNAAPTPTPLFSINLPNLPPSFRPFRGTTQPTTAFNSQGQGRVFFAATRFNPPGDVVACAGTFDTLLFGVSANSGAAVYDYSGDGVADLYTLISGMKTTGIAVVSGQLFVGDSGSLANAPTPTPDPSPTPTPPPPKPAFVNQANFKLNSPVCRAP